MSQELQSSIKDEAQYVKDLINQISNQMTYWRNVSTFENKCQLSTSNLCLGVSPLNPYRPTQTTGGIKVADGQEVRQQSKV